MSEKTINRIDKLLTDKYTKEHYDLMSKAIRNLRNELYTFGFDCNEGRRIINHLNIEKSDNYKEVLRIYIYKRKQEYLNKMHEVSIALRPITELLESIND